MSLSKEKNPLILELSNGQQRSLSGVEGTFSGNVIDEQLHQFQTAEVSISGLLVYSFLFFLNSSILIVPTIDLFSSW